MLYYTGHTIAFFRSDQLYLLLGSYLLTGGMFAELRWLGTFFFLNFYSLTNCFQCAIEWCCDMDYEPKNPHSSSRSASLPLNEYSTPDGPRKSDASEKRMHTETPPYVQRHSTRSLSQGTLCARYRMPMAKQRYR